MTEQSPQDQPPQQEPPQQEPLQAEPPITTEPPATPEFGEVPKDARTMGMLCHLLGIFLGFIGPLVIWLIKKDESPFVDDQGKEALNFQITILIAMFIGGLTACIIIGFVLMAVAGLYALIFSIIGAMKANNGEAYRYPFAIRLIK